MENQYGIGVANRYDLFLQEEDQDPLELLQVREKEKELKKKSKVAEKENKVKTDPKIKPPVAGPRKGIKDAANVKTQEIKVREEKIKPTPRIAGERADRPARVVPGENREERNNRRNREDRPYNVPGDREDRPPRREFGERVHGALRGRGRGGRFVDGRGKREFDRQSGSDKTGIKPVDKREGAGAHNWGTHKDDIVDLNKSSQSESDPSMENDKSDTVPTTENSVADKINEQEAAEADKSAAVEEEPKELTLDEWKAQRGVRQKPNYNLRKAGEGEDLTQWKKMYALDKKKEGEEAETDEELEYDAADYPQRVGRQKRVVEIEFTFNDMRRGGGVGGRGGRGRGRGGPGGAGRGMPRGERPVNRPPFRNEDGVADGVDVPIAEPRDHPPSRGRQNAPKVDDEHDFPSLG